MLQEEKESKTSYLGSSERARRKSNRFEHYPVKEHNSIVNDKPFGVHDIKCVKKY